MQHSQELVTALNSVGASMLLAIGGALIGGVIITALSIFTTNR